ncbi:MULTISPECIES: hypothetical protein [unclassified Mesorhizobium]|uniref:hypothetical protein n=1 Tax=unclassified Mesorhizobium TaxID=325217 RepID=UPI000FCBF1F6|nr:MULTISPECIES: hypothetical protein [unclassified Mesorhizobium]TGU07852.1 hypothetical protein EN806_31400 [bacterium M00.F.Ca.ET.163.01.1.1]TGU47058.1 hypothetical protein EN789_13575 [bacterium M00.F.Ca.ET.146.01.1.1]TGW12714.1 hypothetical protein EN788_08130 [Mesorhizobium sp. M2D.F.Ca.ET.145.01.1.1]TGP33332.1 hypothetical protein EN875_015430 [Mesorhizobium sp. M2D.F.Ca.ET.232.01.1.1]TGP59370.1 hypothetical protein EN869_013910 [Mesorhizobium sp. M2D.F.Ca.ET.226.01.1.1]
MTGSIWSWSTTAASNGSADGNIDAAEGMPPSAVNDSMRQIMGREAEFLADTGGALAVGGTANAITVTANSAFTAYANNLQLGLRIASDNAAGGVTLNANGLGNKAIRIMAASGETDPPAGALKAGCIANLCYGTSFNSAAGAWMLINPVVDVPNLVTLSSTQTLSNKTLASPAMTGNPTAPTAAPGDNDTSVATTAFVAAAISPLATTSALNTGLAGKLATTSAPTNASRKNLKIVTSSVTAGTITADQLVLEDGSGVPFRATSVSVSYATGTSGANGLDTGSITASNWYYEWVIYNGTTVAALLSLSSTAPTMPSGYTFKARVGAVYYDSGAKLRFKIQYDRRAQIVVGTNPTTTLIAASGTSGSPTTPTWTAVAVGTLVPATASTIRVALSGFSSGPTTYIIAAPNNSYGAATSSSNPPPLQAAVKNGGEAIGIYSTVQGEFFLESTNIYYASAAPASALAVLGWEDNI